MLGAATSHRLTSATPFVVLRPAYPSDDVAWGAIVADVERSRYALPGGFAPGWVGLRCCEWRQWKLGNEASSSNDVVVVATTWRWSREAGVLPNN
jgi:hypothetical protein